MQSQNQGLLEELVVTARKKSESLQDTPLSVTALSADQLLNAGATSNYDVALLTPNFSTNQQLGRRLDRPVIRGQSGPAVGGEPNASYFIDGVFVSGSISSATLGPVERVEILRGPQSATFGRATFAGAVNYVTRAPTDEYEGEVRAVYATNDTLQLSGWSSGPIVEDTLRYFVAAGFDEYGGEWQNDLKADQAPDAAFQGPNDFAPSNGDSSDLGGTKTLDLTGKLLWTPTDTTEIGFKLGYTKAEDDHYAQTILEPGELNCYLPTDGSVAGTEDNSGEIWYDSSQGAFCGRIDPDHVNYNPVNPFNPALTAPGTVTGIPVGGPTDGAERQSRFNLPDFYQGVVRPRAFYVDPTSGLAAPEKPGSSREQVRTLLDVTQGLGEWDLTGRLAFNKDDFITAYDLDQREQRPLTGLFTFVEKRDVEDKSFELILSSPQSASLRGSVGVYFFNSELESTARRYTGYKVYEYIQVPPFVVADGLAQFEQPQVRTINNKSVFGAVDWDFTDSWTLSVEARLANDRKRISAPYTCDDPNSQYFGAEATDTTNEDSFTPRVTLRWTPADNAMIYGLVAKGNKPAEFNTNFFRVDKDVCNITAPGIESGATRTKEEESWTYEIGTKTNWFNNRVLINLSAFYIDWTNQSVFATVNLGGTPTNTIDNAGESHVYGLEFESSYGITENFTASLSYGLANGKYDKYTSTLYANTTGIGLDENGDVDPDSNNAKGHYIPFSPKHSIIGSLAYSNNLSATVGWFARTDAVWEDKIYTGAANFLKIGEKVRWNGRLGLDAESWTIATYINNILNDTTPTAAPSFEYLGGSGIQFSNGNFAQTAALSQSRGRQVGVDLVYRWR